MKKRIWFITSSMLLIVLNILIISNASSIIEDSLELLNKLPIELNDKFIDIYSNTKIVIIPAVICIISSIVSLIICILDKINLKRNLLIVLYGLNVVLASYSICSLIGIISIIICATVKVEKKDKIKQEMPKLDRIDTDNKCVLLGVLLIGIYFSQLFCNLSGINSLTIVLLIDMLINVIILSICVLIFKINLKRDIKYLKNNFKGYLSYILPKLGIMYLLYFFACLGATLITGGSTSVNQEIINKMPLFYTLPSAVIIAPIVEEIIFRGCIRRLIKNDTLFIILSGLIFGMLHMIHETNLLNACVLCIPYAVLGGGFAYIYTKTNNITTNILCHSFHNSIALILMILLF